MTEEMFKAYLDMVVEKAFRKGAVWFSYQDKNIEEAIKEAQEEIFCALSPSRKPDPFFRWRCCCYPKRFLSAGKTGPISHFCNQN